ncbi:MAG: hypothetical protein WCZ66_10870 [Sphingomonadaceae bacterium]
MGDIKSEKNARLKVALRANLRKRKDRDRATENAGNCAPESTDEATRAAAPNGPGGDG